MTPVQRAAQIFGALFVLVAILGYLASGTSMEADPAMAEKILGLFPVNLVHNSVHLGFGFWGLLASRNYYGARNFNVVGGALYLVLTALGLLAPDGFGFAPLGGNDIWLHALLGIAMLGVGFTARPPAAARTT